MIKLKGEYLNGENLNIEDIKYKVINSIKDYEDKYTCIVVKNLNPDYYLLFGSVRLIITENGSSLSHLAIVGREQGIPILRVKGITNRIAKYGELSINSEIIRVKNE